MTYVRIYTFPKKKFIRFTVLQRLPYGKCLYVTTIDKAANKSSICEQCRR